MINSEIVLIDLLGSMDEKFKAIPNYSHKQATNLFNWIFSHDDPLFVKDNNGSIFSYRVLIELQNHKKLNQYQQKKVLKNVIPNKRGRFSKNDCFWDIMETFGFNNENKDILSFCFPLICSSLKERNSSQDNWRSLVLCIDKCIQQLPKHVIVDFLRTNTYRDNYFLFEEFSTISCFSKFETLYLPVFESQVTKLSLDELYFLSLNFGDKSHQKIVEKIISQRLTKKSF